MALAESIVSPQKAARPMTLAMCWSASASKHTQGHTASPGLPDTADCRAMCGVVGLLLMHSAIGVSSLPFSPAALSIRLNGYI